MIKPGAPINSEPHTLGATRLRASTPPTPPTRALHAPRAHASPPRRAEPPRGDARGVKHVCMRLKARWARPRPQVDTGASHAHTERELAMPNGAGGKERAAGMARNSTGHARARLWAAGAGLVHGSLPSCVKSQRKSVTDPLFPPSNATRQLCPTATRAAARAPLVHRTPKTCNGNPFQANPSSPDRARHVPTPSPSKRLGCRPAGIVIVLYGGLCMEGICDGDHHV